MFLISNFRSHPLGELGVGPELVAELGQARGELGSGAGEARLGVGVGGVDHGAAGEHELHRPHGLVGVLLHPAAHPARVVGDHAADAGDVGARRIGPELAPVAGEQPVDAPEHDSRLDPHARAPPSSTRARTQ